MQDAQHAADGRGVAHLVLPDEVQGQPSSAAPVRPDGRRSRVRGIPDADAVSDAAALIRAARRPVVIVGQGAREARGSVLDFAERLAAPVLTTFWAKGLVPDSHPHPPGSGSR